MINSFLQTSTSALGNKNVISSLSIRIARSSGPVTPPAASRATCAAVLPVGESNDLLVHEAPRLL